MACVPSYKAPGIKCACQGLVNLHAGTKSEWYAVCYC